MSHPRFGNLRVVRVASEEDEGAIEVGVALPNEVEFKRWEKQLGSLSDSENLFLPTGQRFEKTEFCGSGGITTVPLPPRSSPSGTTPTCCATRS
jgi:hypothetical protein